MKNIFNLLIIKRKGIYFLFSFLVFFLSITILYSNNLTFYKIEPNDLIVNINPSSSAGYAYLYWTSPVSGKYTLSYTQDSTKKDIFSKIDCSANEDIHFKLSANSITTNTNKKAILDLPEGKYYFNLTVDDNDSSNTYAASFTLSVDGTAPSTPTGIQAFPGNKGVTLKWDSPPANNSDIENYYISYSVNEDLEKYIINNQLNDIKTIVIDGNLTEYFISDLENYTIYHFIIRSKDYADNYSEYSVEMTATPMETFTMSDFSGETGGCFIATASFGNYNNPLVIIFRNFRDKILLKSFYGKKLVQLYYNHSPKYAKIISKSAYLKYFSQFILIPIAVISLFFLLIFSFPILSAISLASFFTLIILSRRHT